uniref:Phosphatidylinositol 4-kinase type 2 n=1 Tax=Heterorhabditis bacteriophora TaxID=37862 RepID=A0A1I7XMH1_HETBA
MSETGASIVDQMMRLFVHDYESALRVFSRWDYDKSLLSPDDDKKFTFLFQKMCVLDYVIRNTDRHMDNLLIKSAEALLN